VDLGRWPGEKPLVSRPEQGGLPSVPRLNVGEAGAIDGVAPLDRESLSGVVTVFREAFPGNLLGTFGRAFLTEIFASYVDLPDGVAFVFRQDHAVVGFILGSIDSAQHRNQLLRQRWAHLSLYVLRAVATAPRLLGPLARYLRCYPWPMLGPAGRQRALTGPAPLPPASLVLLAVAPSYRRRGIAADLTQAFFTALRRRGVDQVKLVVAAANAPALAFYRTHDWETAGRYLSPDGEEVYRLLHWIGLE